MMKNSKMLILAGIALSSGWQAAHAQREAPSRAERRTQRQQANQNLTPDQQRQNLEARFQERLQSATPEQRAQMMQMRSQIEERMRNGSLTGADMATIQQFMGGAGSKWRRCCWWPWWSSGTRRSWWRGRCAANSRTAR